MFVHRISKFQGGQTQIQSITTQPHGQLIFLYEGYQNRILVLEVLSIYKYFEVYRMEFKQNNKYTFEMKIPQVMRIEPHESDEGINQILVAQKYKNQQCVIFVYISQIEVVTVDIRSFEILRRRVYTFPFQIVHAAVIKHTVYVSMFNATLAAIQLDKDRELNKNCLKMITAVDISDFITKPVKNNKQSIQLRQISRFVEETEQQPRLWQSINGYLMKGQQIIGSQYIEHLNMSNSMEEFNYRQHHEFFPIKYYLSQCKKYLVGCQYAKSTQGLNSIRSKNSGWAEVFESNYRPEINPYWTCYQESKKQFNKDLEGNRIKLQKTRKNESILIAYFDQTQKAIVISEIIVDYQSKKKQNTPHSPHEHHQSISQTKTKYKSAQKHIVSLKNVKRRVSEIKWIGLNQLLYIQESEYLYYVQFQFRFLEKQMD